MLRREAAVTRNVELLRAVARHPDEDTPRLAYADWLDENDQPERAEFVRGQVELATLTEDSPRRREVAFRCRLLLDAHEQAWLDPDDAFAYDWAWSRGFVETFTTTPQDLEFQDAGLFDTHPFRRVWVTDLGGRADGLALLPADNRVTALDLSAGGLTTNALKRLAKFTHLPQLTELGLIANDLRDTAVKVLCGEAFFRRLRLIRLAGNPLTPAARDRLRRHFSYRVSFAPDRDPGQLYTIRDDRLRVGWGNDFTQVLGWAGPDGNGTAVFDHAGNLLRTEEQGLGGPDGAAARDARLAELGCRSATIRVKRFRVIGGEGLAPFNGWLGACERPRDPERADHVARVRRWLDDGRYRFDDGRHDAWFDRDGQVTDT
jgi:uncharacterized protein (TIGR02996 family)